MTVFLESHLFTCLVKVLWKSVVLVQMHVVLYYVS